MKTVSPPGELLAEVAQGLLAAAERLGLPATVVATTTGAEFGYGFVVPDDVFDAWFLTRGEAKPMATVEIPTDSGVTEDLESTEEPGVVAEAPKPKVKRGTAKPAADEKEA